MNVTVTEGLQEIKTTAARIEKKHENVMRYFNRDSRLKDPLLADGGSAEYVRRERQAIADLQERIVKIRGAIQNANASTQLKVAGESRSVMDWLNWRRDISDSQKKFLGRMINQLNQVRQAVKSQGGVVTTKEGESLAPVEIVISVDEKELASQSEKLEQTLGELDGKLSLINATTVIEIPD